MKKYLIITSLILTTIVVLFSCKNKREPGRIYMPDMAYSRAFETYAVHDSAEFTESNKSADYGNKIFYNSQPVAGTIKRGALFPYTVPNDSNGLINLSSQVQNPLAPLNKIDSLEAGRLFNIYCAVCHGPKAENNGPLAPKIGGVKSIMAAAGMYSDGRIFHIMQYGQGNMGSYASQLSSTQRWMIVQYIRSLQKAAAPVATTTTAKTDSVKTTMTAVKK